MDDRALDHALEAVANIALNNAMILPYDATPSRMEFSEGKGNFYRPNPKLSPDEIFGTHRLSM
jgi:hypothetical protein